MSLEAVPFDTFGLGLNLRDKEDAVRPGEAVDALNVEYTERGAVKQRPGYDNLTAALTLAAGTIAPYYTTGGTTQLVAGCGTRLEGIATDGSVVASATGLTSGTWGFARFGTPGSELVYAGQGNTNLNSWNGTAWTTAIANTPDAGALAVMPVSNRLVAARFNTTTGGPTGGASTSSPSHVYFSDPGDPATWTSTNFIQITPGDGEKIQAVVAFGNFIFIFKETKYAVVFGESTDSGGDPVFDYRVIEAGVGALGPKAVCVGTDGVYFASRRGVYRTTGETPQRLSDLISPIFDSTQTVSGYYQGGTLLHSQASNTALWWHNDRLYAGFTSAGSANDYTLVYDPAYEWWSLTNLPAACGTSFRRSSTPELVFADTTNKKVYYSNTSHTNDDGTAITSRWRSGWHDLGIAAQKTSRAQVLWGDGIVEVDVAADFEVGGNGRVIDMTNPAASGTNFGGTGTLGGTGYFGDRPPGITEAQRRVAARGTVFSVLFRNSTLNQEWKIDRFAHLVRQPRRPSAQDD